MKVVIKPSKAKGKKFTAIFSKDGKKIKTTQFGDSRYQDYTLSKDKKQRSKYRERHKKDLEKGDYMSAGHLSYYILWGAYTDRNKNITAYRRRFKLK